MEGKVYKHLGYSPGEEWDMGTLLSQGCDGTVQELIELLAMLTQSYDNSVIFALTNPKPLGQGISVMANWESSIQDNCVEVNQLCTTLLLSCLALAENNQVDEAMVNRLLRDEMTKQNLRDSHFFEENTLMSLFSLSSYTRLYVYNIPNRGTGSVNISNDIKSVTGSYLLKAGNELGTQMVAYHHMLSMKAVAKLVNLSTLLSALEKGEDSIRTQEHKNKAILDTLVEVVISLDMLGYKYDTCIGISKTLAVDENN